MSSCARLLLNVPLTWLFLALRWFCSLPSWVGLRVVWSSTNSRIDQPACGRDVSLIGLWLLLAECCNVYTAEQRQHGMPPGIVAPVLPGERHLLLWGCHFNYIIAPPVTEIRRQGR